jgi:transposase
LRRVLKGDFQGLPALESAFDVTRSLPHGPVAAYGYSRDERRGNPRIVFGILSSAEGCPVAVEVYEGYTGDPKIVAARVTAAC